MNEPFRITELYAFVSVGEDGHEGICGFLSENDKTFYPLVATDLARLKDWFPIAEAMTQNFGVTIKLLRFTTREHLSTITADGVVYL